MCACMWHVVGSLCVCVYIYESMFLWMNTGMHVPWHICGSQKTALGISSLCGLLEAISLLSFLVKTRPTDKQASGCLMSSSPMSP